MTRELQPIGQGQAYPRFGDDALTKYRYVGADGVKRGIMVDKATPEELAQWQAEAEEAGAELERWFIGTDQASRMLVVDEAEPRVDMVFDETHKIYAIGSPSPENVEYRQIFGRDPEAWREPLGALRLTLAGDPEKVDVKRAQAEVEELVRVLNEGVGK